MTVLILNKLYINRVDTGELISGASGRGRTQAFGSPAYENRSYANGRQRTVSAVGETGHIPYTLIRMDLATCLKLRLWKKITVQVRDHRGQKWFGTFGAVDISEYMPADLYAASFTLDLVTFTEGV